MRSAAFSLPDDESGLFRRRAASFALALALEALVIIALIIAARQSVSPPPTADQATFQLLPEGKTAEVTKTKRAVRTSPKAKAAPPAKAAVKPPLPVTPLAVPQMIQLSADAFAASDISKLPSHGSTTGEAKNSVAAYGPGEGPGGKTLYNAEWYREPTDAELAFYLPRGIGSGTALIACRTVEKYHVEDCESLGETPVGSGLARALRLASWQFLVRPPRIDGKAQVGAWVKIRFDLTTRSVK